MSCDILVIHSAEETETESKKNEKIITTHIYLFTVLTAAINVPNVRTHNE